MKNSIHLLPRARPSGFSLIEVLVVLAILGVLAAFIVPRVMSRPDEARVIAAKQGISAIVSALHLYKLDNFSYPSPEQGLRALVEKPLSAPVPANYPAGGYLQSLPNDPWGRPYQYLVSPGGQSIEVFSLGADGQPNGEGLNADISSKGI